MRRREFITLLGGATAWPFAARAQQQVAMPVIAFIRDGWADGNTLNVAGFRKGLSEAGYVEGQNVKVEYHGLEGQYDRLPAVLSDVVRRQVALIATSGNTPSIAAKAETATIPIIFGVGEDPVQLGLVASLAKPGGNATGINFLIAELAAKRLWLLHDLIPNAVRIAVLVNPGNVSATGSTLRDLQKAAPTMGLQIQTLKAMTISEINVAFDTLARERPDALFVAPDAFLTSRRVQLVTLATRHAIPTTYPWREAVEIGGLMSYGVDLVEIFRLIGLYSSNILKGTKPADLPVMQSTKLEFVINLTAAKALGLAIPAGVLSIADEAIE
jgi:putative ABC transport system substrate-binding protein